jgi:2-oxoisovalerate dehydrogenase E1 component
MQAIPATGIAQGIAHLEKSGRIQNRPVVLCSFGDASITEGEVSEAFQFAALRKLPIIYLVQDNEWGISVSAEEARSMVAVHYAGGFAGMGRINIHGSDLEQSFHCMQQVFQWCEPTEDRISFRQRVPLLTHHTSGVRGESYRRRRSARHRAADPLPALTPAAKARYNPGTHIGD